MHSSLRLAVVGATVGVSACWGAPLNAAKRPLASPSSTAAIAECASRAEISSWPLRDRAANLVMVGINIREGRRAAALLRSEGLGGVLVRGTPSVAETPTLKAMRNAGRHGNAFIAVDEEGGRVQHLRTAVGVLPSARSFAKTKSPAQLRAAAAAHGRAMRAMGFTMNLAPVVDLEPSGSKDSSLKRNGVGDRSYGSDPNRVAEYGEAFAMGMLDAGIVPILKHFPGHGNASGDSHNIAATTPPLTAMKAADLTPFGKILVNQRVGVMTSHLRVPGLDTEPTSLSERAVTGLLRGEFRVRGLVVTDSLSMWPIRYHHPAPEAAELALRAGNDVLLFDDEPAVDAVIDHLTEVLATDKALAEQAIEANLRILAAKGRTLCEPARSFPTTEVVDTTATTEPKNAEQKNPPPAPAEAVKD